MGRHRMLSPGDAGDRLDRIAREAADLAARAEQDGDLSLGVRARRILLEAELARDRCPA